MTIQLPHMGTDDGAAATAPPSALPVLPLKDSVTFPDTLTPLAVGQERSVRLVNDVLGMMGFSNLPAWIATPEYALGTIILLHVWTFGSPMSS